MSQPKAQAYHNAALALIRSGSLNPAVLSEIERFWQKEAKAWRYERREDMRKAVVDDRAGSIRLADRIASYDGKVA